MRKGWMIGAASALLASAAPAQAQFGVPFGGAGMLTSPEAASGAMGAGAAHSAQQQQCGNATIGRGRPSGPCEVTPPPPRPRR